MLVVYPSWSLLNPLAQPVPDEQVQWAMAASWSMSPSSSPASARIEDGDVCSGVASRHYGDRDARLPVEGAELGLEVLLGVAGQGEDR